MPGTIRSLSRFLRIAAALTVASLAPACAHVSASSAPAAVAASPKTVFLVRHAEKVPHPAGGDSGLSTKGTVRAQVLARTLKDAGVTAIYASQFGRAQLTALPLARETGDSVRTYDANYLEALVKRVRAEAPGGTVLIVGHSDTISETYENFTGERLPKDEQVTYDKLYVVTFAPDGTHRLVRLRYGAPDE